MKVLKSSLAKKVFADLAAHGQLSAFVASTTTLDNKVLGRDKVFSYLDKQNSKETKITTRVVSRIAESEAVGA